MSFKYADVVDAVKDSRLPDREMHMLKLLML
jgi:hypothetical protein